MWLQDTAYYPDVNLYWAKRIASSMFAQAGVRIRWQSGQPGSFQAQPPIVLSFTSNTPEKFPPDIFANALVFEGVHIRIFVDHVAERAHHATPLTTYLLAHVMVHEITHMLERVDRHSREGIMKARWTEADIQGMVVKPLSFAAEDIRLIHLGLADRNRAKSQLLTARGEVSSRLSSREGAYSNRATAWGPVSGEACTSVSTEIKLCRLRFAGLKFESSQHLPSLIGIIEGETSACYPRTSISYNWS